MGANLFNMAIVGTLVPFASLLFVSGVAFTWAVMLPTAVPFLTSFLGITTQVRPNNYFEFVTSLMFWIGVSFETPLIMMVLSKLGIVSAKQIASKRKFAIVIIAIAAAVITPTPDPFNMMIVMVPLYFLFELGILLSRVAGKPVRGKKESKS
jgi:sec-independent protein translocase protein TatC